MDRDLKTSILVAGATIALAAVAMGGLYVVGQRNKPPERAPVAARSPSTDGFTVLLYAVANPLCPAGGQLANSTDRAGNVLLTGCWWRKDQQVGILWADGDGLPYDASLFTWGQ